MVYRKPEATTLGYMSKDDDTIGTIYNRVLALGRPVHCCDCKHPACTKGF